jgi:hypothetical protein
LLIAQPSPATTRRAVGNTASHARSLFVDSRTEGDRLWAIDAALRCPGVVVVADGSSLNTAATRRLQLAAEATGTIAFLARPAHEVKSISVAATRCA